ncbi:hypothetical protein [Brevundimonas sp.]|uniref:hypothetical protein n=1 Tax=Brevundimonas sp. TaxID=1871086 RepID=UPI002737FDE7|nr:hypothetical protein [Brevundimonas sp.]MDP3801888.1 hypothetical protein [Brevundimonas sp.]
MHKLPCAALAAVFTVHAPAVAMSQTAEPAAAAPAPRPMSDFLVNRPHVPNWTIWGLPNGPELRNDPGVTGGQALRVVVPGQVDPWAIGGVMPANAEIRTGDVVLLAVWLRAVPAEGAGEASARISLLKLEQKDVPDGTIAGASDVEVGARWQMVYASGVATKDYAADQTVIAVLLAARPQTIDVGPALLFNLGPGFDTARLPRNLPRSSAAP